MLLFIFKDFYSITCCDKYLAKLAVYILPNFRFILIQTCGYRDKAEREADTVIVFEDDSWALVEVKLCNNEEIKEASKKLVNLSNDIDITRHPKPAFL